MPGLKTNEREGTRAVLRHARVSPYKVREVLDLVRGRPVHEAEDILRFSERDAAFVVGKVLHSAVANAEENDELDPEELFVSACFGDEGTTIKRWRPRARGRATRIRKRTCHITIIVSRMEADELARLQQHRRAEQLAQRARRVAAARRSEGDTRNRAERRRRAPIPSAPEEEEEEVPALEEAAAEGETAPSVSEDAEAPLAAEDAEAALAAEDAEGPEASEEAPDASEETVAAAAPEEDNLPEAEGDTDKEKGE